MLKYIEEFGKYVVIDGFRNVEIKNVEEFFESIRKEKPPKVDIQFFNANLVTTWQHLYFAVLNALTTFKNKKSISKSLEMETILYASAQRQIRKAIELLGIKRDSSNIAVLIVGDKPGMVKSTLSMISSHVNAQLDDTVLDLNEEKVTIIRKTFGISDIELKTVIKKDELQKALTDLVIERMAILTTQR